MAGTTEGGPEGNGAAGKAAGARVSPLAPKGGMPALPVIRGARFAAVEAGVRYKGRRDVMLVALDAGTALAGVFTRSQAGAAASRLIEFLASPPAREVFRAKGFETPAQNGA